MPRKKKRAVTKRAVLALLRKKSRRKASIVSAWDKRPAFIGTGPAAKVTPFDFGKSLPKLRMERCVKKKKKKPITWLGKLPKKDPKKDEVIYV